MTQMPPLPDEATLDKILAAYEHLPSGPFFWGNQWLMAAQAGQPAIAGPYEGDLLLRHWPGKNSMPMWAYSEIAPDSLAPGGLDNPAAIALASAWLVPLLIRQNRELRAAPAATSVSGGADAELKALTALYAATRELHLTSRCHAEVLYAKAAAEKGEMWMFNGDTNKLVADIVEAACTVGSCYLPGPKGLLARLAASPASVTSPALSAPSSSGVGVPPNVGLRVSQDFDTMMTKMDLSVGSADEELSTVPDYQAYVQLVQKAWEPLIMAYTTAWSAAAPSLATSGGGPVATSYPEGPTTNES